MLGRGAGPQDGFAGYKAFGDPPRPRWGDYGATAIDGNAIWMASEFIGQTCSFQRYLADTPSSPMFTCGNTRTSLANWGTRISRVTRSTDRVPGRSVGGPERRRVGVGVTFRPGCSG